MKHKELPKISTNKINEFYSTGTKWILHVVGQPDLSEETPDSPTKHCIML
jgi:hypothetical protein